MWLTNETPFFMTYGAEVVILVEISMTSMRVVGFFPGSNDAQVSENLDFLEERRDMVSVRFADYQ